MTSQVSWHRLVRRKYDPCSSSEKGGLEPLNDSFLYILIKSLFLLHSLSLYLVLYFGSSPRVLRCSAHCQVQPMIISREPLKSLSASLWILSAPRTLQPLCRGSWQEHHQGKFSDGGRSYWKPENLPQSQRESLPGGSSLCTQLIPSHSVSTLVPGTRLRFTFPP